MSRVRPFSWSSNIPRCGRTTSSSDRPLIGTQAASRSCLLICGIRRTEVLWGVCVSLRPRATCPQPSVLCFLHADGVIGRRPGALGVLVSACAFAAHARRPEPALAPRSRLHWNNIPSSGWTTFHSFTHPAMDTWVASTFLWYEE